MASRDRCGKAGSSSSSSSSVRMPRAFFKTRIDAASRSAVGVLTVEAGDLLLRASCTDDSFINGPALEGLSLGVEKPGAFVFDYDLGARAPSFQFMSTAKVGTRSLNLAYSHRQSDLSATSIEAAFTVDPRNKLACSYDFCSNAGKLKYAYVHHDGTSVEPAFDFGSNTWDFAVARKLSKDDSIKGTFKGLEKSISLDWTRSGRGGGTGPFKVYADIPLGDSTKPPKLMMEKTWSY